MTQNLHTHSTFCDGKNAPGELVHEAIRMDMDALGFSSHAPLAGQSDWTMSPEDVPRYRAEILRLRERYAGRLEIFLGLEQDYFSPPPGDGWDYLIGSVHCVEKEGSLLSVDNLPEDFVRSAQQYYGGDFYAFAEDYYRLVAGVAEKTNCQIVGHFDLITKFNEGDRLFDTGHPRYVRAALEALDQLAERDVVFEINTGAMSRGYRSVPYPAPWLLRAMGERNLPICITSDCHDRSNLLYAFSQAAELAWDCGYREQMVLTAQGFVPEKLKR
ncbi:MAG: histidinol-phosphatase [Lawsonibacter sp.]|nr:histidinol-phosphatase [Lawsonibacter sp.]